MGMRELLPKTRPIQLQVIARFNFIMMFKDTDFA